MRLKLLVPLSCLWLVAAWSPSAQAPPKPTGASLVGTWVLISAERLDGAQGPSTIPNPRGLLVFDSAGHALEIVTRAGRRPYAANQPTPAEAQQTFADFAGFWGSYRVDERQGTIRYRPEGAVNPQLMGEELVRSFDEKNERLTITSPAGAREGQAGARWIWERVPPLETLSGANRALVGFWQHVVERRVNVATGVMISETHRAPGVIVYTPSGHVGVHFPPLNRKRFAAEAPTDDEARAAVAGYVAYYGVYLLYPGIVFHHQLATIGPGQGTSFRRFYEITGGEINLKFPPAAVQGQEVRTIVTLKRLSGEAEMLGK